MRSSHRRLCSGLRFRLGGCCSVSAYRCPSGHVLLVSKPLTNGSSRRPASGEAARPPARLPCSVSVRHHPSKSAARPPILGVMTLNLELRRPLRSRAEQRALVEAVRDAPTFEQETHWLEWKGSLDLDSKEGRAAIAKAILGFANRSPDTALRPWKASRTCLWGSSLVNCSG